MTPFYDYESFGEEGRSTAEIGRQLGISKNAVIGKAHRLKLSQRPSPIRVAPPGEPRPSRRSRPSPQTLPDGSPPGCAAQKPSRASLPPLASSSDPFASTLPLPVLARPPRLNFGKTACCWPLGEPGGTISAFATPQPLAANLTVASTAALLIRTIASGKIRLPDRCWSQMLPSYYPASANSGSGSGSIIGSDCGAARPSRI